MDKFEQLFKQAVEGYEAPFNPQAWDNVSKDLPDAFDQSMKESAGNYEAPYNPAAWDAVSSQLGPSYTTLKWIGGAAAVVAVVAGVSYFSSDDNDNQSENSTTPIVHHEDVANNMIVHENDEIDHNIEDDDVFVVSENEIEDSENPIDFVDPEIDNGNELLVINEDEENVVINEEDGNLDNKGNEQTNDTESHNVSDEKDKEDQHFAPVHVNPNFSLENSEICEGAKAEFTLEEVNPKLNYSWNFGDGSISSTFEPLHRFRKAGNYTVNLVITNPKNGKVVGKSSESIVVNELPQTDFSYTRINQGIPTVTFNNTSYDGEVVLWNVKGLKQSRNAEFEYTFRKKGNYTVGLTTKNDYGCTKKVEKTIKIDNDYNLLAPTAFSPDGDGNSDKFIPAALTVMDVDFTMTIMDKSGKLVYSTQNAYEPWDGRFTEDNTLAPSGSSYIWRVVLINKTGEQEFYEGQVFVVY